MLTIYLLLISTVAALMSIKRHAKTFNLYFLVGLIFIYSVIYFVQIATVDTDKGTYFNLIAADGYRYLKEANDFEKPWLIDEINGVYRDSKFQYEATPKFGLSAYVAALTPLSNVRVEFAYFLMLIGSLALSFLKIKLINELNVGLYNKVLLTLTIVFFPLDLYWSLRFLREIIANDLLELTFLYVLVRRQRINPMIISSLVLALLVWRSQLTLLAIPLLLLVFRLKFSLIAFLVVIVGVSFSQVAKASGVTGLIFIGLPQFFVDFISLFAMPNTSWFFIFGIVAISVIFNVFEERRSASSRVPLVFGSILYGALFVLSFLLFHQIRFWYPIFEIFKIFVAILFARSFRIRQLDFRYLF